MRAASGYLPTVSTSPLDPQDIRAAAEIHRELGPEYSDAVIAAFIDRVDQAVAARVEAKLAEERRFKPAVRGGHRRTLLKGVALGVCAGALVAGVSISRTHPAGGDQGQSKIVVPRHEFGHKGWLVPAKPGPRDRIIKPAAPPPPPAA